MLTLLRTLFSREACKETFGYTSDQNFLDLWPQLQPELAGCTLPGILPTSTVDQGLFQGLEGVALTISLRTLTFGYEFDRNMHGVTMPCILQSWTCGFRVNQNLQDVMLPVTMPSSTST
jgi:hypothetical protein